MSAVIKSGLWDSFLFITGILTGIIITMLFVNGKIKLPTTTWATNRAGYAPPNTGFKSSPYQKEISLAAAAKGLDPNILYAIVEIESGNDPNAVSEAGAQGLGQLMPEIQRAFGVDDPFDPAQNLAGAAEFLSILTRKYDQLEMAIAAYHAGEPLVDNCNCVPRAVDVEYVTRFFKVYKPVVLPYRVDSTLVGDLHGEGRWVGRDYATDCKTPLYATITGEVSAVGTDSYVGPHGSNNTFMQITGTGQHSGLKVVLLHGNYSVEIGDSVIQSVTRIGSEASVGNSTGCHSHIITKYQGQIIDPVELI
jgi:murein DD-endopeptidase MepM/ murein hydrolase activator NlpD